MEAHYIYSLIELAGRKLGRKYVKVLDVPCGVGRHHRYLREYGLDVYGLDVEEELIKICLDNYGEYGDHYSVMDMRNISYWEEFDVVLNWYTSFGYFGDEENAKVLKNFYNALTRKGILILDYPSYWSSMLGASMHGDKYMEINMLREIEKHRFHFKAKLYEISDGHNKLSKVDEIDMIITIYPPEVLRNMLEEVGFKILYAFRERTFRHLSLDRLTLYNVMRARVSRILWLAYKP